MAAKEEEAPQTWWLLDPGASWAHKMMSDRDVQFARESNAWINLLDTGKVIVQQHVGGGMIQIIIHDSLVDE